MADAERAATERLDEDESIIVALGGNLALDGVAPDRTLHAALAALPTVGLRVVAASRLWSSAAWPNASGPPFLNAVAWVETTLAPDAAMAALHGLETRFGRRRGAANAPRTLDLDLIAYRRLVSAGVLVLPHPRAAERLFVMGPLAEIAPRWRHPTLGMDAATLAARASVGRDATPLQASVALQ